jgi:hypothetical protein
MSGPKLPARTQRILARIEKQPSRTVSDELLQRLAYLTALYAAQEFPDPFGRACFQLREVWGFQLECERAPLPVADEAQPTVRLVDERNGDQWTESALAYLRWRQGLDWRRTSERRDPVVEERACAIHLLTQLAHAPHDAVRLAAFLALQTRAPAPAPQLVLQFPAQRAKTKRAAA